MTDTTVLVKDNTLVTRFCDGSTTEEVFEEERDLLSTHIKSIVNALRGDKDPGLDPKYHVAFSSMKLKDELPVQFHHTCINPNH